MSNRAGRKAIAEETMVILEKGSYQFNATTVSIRQQMREMKKATVTVEPRFSPVYSELDAARVHQTVFEVTPEMTLTACRRLTNEAKLEDGEEVLALNFASARNPGGGFLSGAQAQEESLARASGLYASLISNDKMYRYNSAHARDGLYSDYMIYSPHVPVFRDDDDQLIEDPYNVSIITSPAVNRSRLGNGKTGKAAGILNDEINHIMMNRLSKVLYYAWKNGHKKLVLGAWGCGVFGHEGKAVSWYFKKLLLSGGTFESVFEKVVFAIKTPRPDEDNNFLAFKKVFGTPP